MKSEYDFNSKPNILIRWGNLFVIIFLSLIFLFLFSVKLNTSYSIDYVISKNLSLIGSKYILKLNSPINFNHNIIHKCDLKIIDSNGRNFIFNNIKVDSINKPDKLFLSCNISNYKNILDSIILENNNKLFVTINYSIIDLLK